MRITKVSIQKFRSIMALDFLATPLTAICGPNSCGKSNILRAIKFAFLPSYSPERMPTNICHDLVGPNTACQIELTFDAPIPALVDSLKLKDNSSFTYSVQVKRNGSMSAFLNNTKMDNKLRDQFLDAVLVVYVPPIRDIASEGLKPFKDTLTSVLRKSRGTTSFTYLNDQVRKIVKARGKALLDGTKDVAQHLLRVDELVVNVDGIDLEQLLPSASLNVRIRNNEEGLDKLGTGHQSSVILQLYRQLGRNTGKFVLYLFEEPDNHLHPTALRAIGEDLMQCSSEGDTSVLLTTHSPYLLNQFDYHNILALTSDKKRLTLKRPKRVTRSDREVRVALGNYGLKPAEALLADKVVVVEGPSDVTFLRTLFELETKITPDRQDILIIPAGGKQQVSELCVFLHELGVNWRAVFDWDATENTFVPLFQTGLNATDIEVLQVAAKTIQTKLYSHQNKNTKAKKLVKAMLSELADPKAPVPRFEESILDVFIRKLLLLDETTLNHLKNSVSRHQFVKIRQNLSPKGVWIWSGSIEDVILRNSDAENDIEQIFRTSGKLKQTFQNPTDRRPALFNLLKEATYEPEVIRRIIESLWKANRFDRSEAKSAINFLLS